MTKYRITYTADTEGNWCSECEGVLYGTLDEAQAALEADPTAQPDCFGNQCYPSVRAVGTPRAIPNAATQARSGKTDAGDSSNRKGNPMGLTPKEQDAQRAVLKRARQLGADLDTLDTLAHSSVILQGEATALWRQPGAVVTRLAVGDEVWTVVQL